MDRSKIIQIQKKIKIPLSSAAHYPSPEHLHFFFFGLVGFFFRGFFLLIFFFPLSSPPPPSPPAFSRKELPASVHRRRLEYDEYIPLFSTLLVL